MKISKKFIFGLPILAASVQAFGIDITTTNSAADLADQLFDGHSSGITIMGTTLSGANMSAGTYRNLAFAPLSNISQGIILTSGDAQLAKGPNDAESQGLDNGGPSESFFNYDGLGNTADLNDVTKLSVTFSCTTEQKLSFHFSFGSEEFYEWVNSQYNDSFLTFIDDNPITLSRDLNGNAITVNNQFFRVDNRPQGWSEFDVNGENFLPCNGTQAGIDELQYDGFTPTLKTTFTVGAGTHTLSFVIGDAGDHVYDSGVFISNGLANSEDDDGTGEDPTPEPASVAVLGVGALALLRRRRKK